ncbi:hypothetical protein COT75_05000 [Candidatus Beckwithbacteria bacterium CG10_big_fil_rev_8_21_14_0_10_34_10]|uniref:asparagine synthase (glutamine-hydrolyzing) n=1 Tax=Candidatus Beckwithbacteria bacterium CG10_big_fil_rev_8_21_14_0_10_34_10 TaxID=1974495 RepID=A0A2H0WA61_9BACT|nr:MAG: hypothetical protein COT75_05000 [Candidatus Beckwithbacteria bacterium CG10_big_fil_rev_8_21_14_0_10_34_10]
MSTKKEIDQTSLAKYLLYGFIPAPATIFKNIKKPIFKDYQLDYSKKLTNWSKEEIKSEIVRLLKKAVQNNLNNKNKPVGILLSGGIDSSLTLAFMAQFLPASQIKAFTIGFREKPFDESCYAKKVANHFKVKHYLKIFSEKETLNLVKKVAYFLDEPMADPSIIPTYLAFSLAKKRVKTVFLGDAGDEALAGYPKYLAHFFLEKTHLKKLPLFILSNFFSGKIKKFLQYSSYPLYLRNQLWINPFSPKEVEKLLGIKPDFSELEKLHQTFKGKNPLDEAFYLDQQFTLPYLYMVKTQVVSQATKLKMANPFLDKKLFKFCAQIPFNLKLEGFKTKSLLKNISLDYLPKEIVFRSKKGFGFPLSKWLDNSLRPFVLKELSQKKIKKEGILNSRAVNQVLIQDNPQQIWTLLIFELWLKKHLKN